MSEVSAKSQESVSELLTTFYVGNEYYGIEVMKVQEVTGTPVVVPVPLAPNFVRGLINLRGQLATALGLRELFGAGEGEVNQQMSVVCRMDGNLVSLIVDQIGDVVEVEGKIYEESPETLPPGIRKYVKGIYKMNGTLLSLLDMDKITKELAPNFE
ncbi:MAG: chemotaxis protein CheW [Bdellovibrionales bacterium]|nr:chemotaxis protein CheW [Bdellovibrionales bacterium]